jgi:simple sugar transport system ATP-binding protein
VTDRFPLLNRGTMLGPYEKSVIDLPELTSQMDGGAELTALEHELRSA